MDPIRRLDGYRYGGKPFTYTFTTTHAVPFLTASYPSDRFRHLFLLRYQEQQRGQQQVLPPVRACSSDQGSYLHGGPRWQRRGGEWPLIPTEVAPSARCGASAPWGDDVPAPQLWVEEFYQFLKRPHKSYLWLWRLTWQTDPLTKEPSGSRVRSHRPTRQILFYPTLLKVEELLHLDFCSCYLTRRLY